MTTATLLLSGLLLATGCGGATSATPSGATGSPDEPVSTSAPVATPAPSAPYASPSPVTPKGGVADPRPIRWTKVTPVGDTNRVQILWTSGVEPCHTLDRVDVKETDRTVEITLYEGTPQDAQNVACIEIAIEKTTTVTLKAPLGDRKVIDGA
ncbi:hypothetical protein HNP84_007454 [Thermocatellispora tengchongensis]|uniref:Uncharacterized protein n=1 Tax=Thermocatellispora tengchongensis TaxID=1073253 RepID=A0A840PEV0_9ACTN|nr:hypothetical protein [Thermocatellispora tengchongensis]MBB5137702.1 hypothetical protein [Thermocatellispora tengchongensis]